MSKSKNRIEAEFTYAKLYKAQAGRCFYCNSKMSSESWREDNKRGWTRDHFMPFSKGHTLVSNVVLACGTCNRNKSDRAPCYAMVERFIELYSHAFPVHFHTTRNEGITEWMEAQSLLNRITSWVGKPNISGVIA